MVSCRIGNIWLEDLYLSNHSITSILKLGKEAIVLMSAIALNLNGVLFSHQACSIIKYY